MNANLQEKKLEQEIESARSWMDQEPLYDNSFQRTEYLFTEIYQKYNAIVYRIAFRILKDHAMAEDARQDSFMNIYRGLQFFRGESKLSTWITRITVNVCLGLLRKKKRHTMMELDSQPETYSEMESLSAANPFHDCSASESKERVHRALGDISGKHGEVVRLHDLEGHTIPEIAKQLRVPSGTIKSRLFYGRQELRDRLEQLPASSLAN